jgi:hypothetical protein
MLVAELTLLLLIALSLDNQGQSMNQRIVYPTDDGGVAVIIPAPECLKTHAIEEIAAKDVPAGKPYKIVNVNDIPTDRTFRNAWEATIDMPDGVGAESNKFPKEAE